MRGCFPVDTVLMHLGNRCQFFWLLFLRLSERIVRLYFYITYQRAAQNLKRSWVLPWKDPQRAWEWNPFSSFTDFILSFIVSFLLFFWTWIVSGLSATWCRCLHPLPCQHSPSHYSQNLISLSEPPRVKDPFGTTWLFPSAWCVFPDSLSGKSQALTIGKYQS